MKKSGFIQKIYEVGEQKQKTIGSGLIIGVFLIMLLSMKYPNKENINLYISGVSIVIYIGKWNLIEKIGYLYNTLISKKVEEILIVILIILNLFNFTLLKVLPMIFVVTYLINFATLLFIFSENIFIKQKKENIEEDNSLKNELFSFRKRELKQLDELVKDSNVASILIDDKIGGGKTFLIECYLESHSLELEVVNLKLPLLESSEVLKQEVENEIFKILRKNKIFLKNKRIFFNKVSAIKTPIFEIGIFDIKSNWDLIKELREGIRRLKDNGKQILIILDDIERENNKDKIRESIIFLGELSDYLKNTPITFLFISQYKSIIETMNGAIRNVENEIDIFEKYFRYRLRLYSPEISDLSIEDLSMLIRKYLKQNENIDEEILNLNIVFMFELLKEINGKIEKNSNNFRVLSKYIIYFKNELKESLNNNSLLIWLYIYKAIEMFLEKKDLSDSIDDILYNKLYEKLKNEIDMVEKYASNENKKYAEMLYIKGGLKDKEIRKVEEEIICDYLVGNLSKDIEPTAEQIMKYWDTVIKKLDEKNANKIIKKANLLEIEDRPLIDLILKIKKLSILEAEALENIITNLYVKVKEDNFYTIISLDKLFPSSLINDESNRNDIYGMQLKMKKNELVKVKEILNNDERLKEDSKVLEIFKELDKHIENPEF